MRKTNKQKYDELYNELKIRTAAFLVAKFPDGLPTKMYKVTLKQMQTLDITSYHIPRMHYCIDNPNNKDIQRLKDFINKNEITDNDINIGYTYKLGTSTVTGAEGLDTLNKTFYLDLDLATEKLNSNLSIYGDREGYITCSYCYKQVKIEEAVSYEISFRNSGRLVYQTNKYCSSKCGVHNQMGCEG